LADPKNDVLATKDSFYGSAYRTFVKGENTETMSQENLRMKKTSNIALDKISDQISDDDIVENSALLKPKVRRKSSQQSILEEDTFNE
jgi:hypothetical protein